MKSGNSHVLTQEQVHGRFKGLVLQMQVAQSAWVPNMKSRLRSTQDPRISYCQGYRLVFMLFNRLTGGSRVGGTVSAAIVSLFCGPGSSTICYRYLSRLINSG